MFISPTNTQEVAKVLEHLKNEKKRGHDGISNEIVKSCSPIVDSISANFFKESIQKSTYPIGLKLAKNTPSFKKGQRIWPKNYRPINLISSLSKVIQKLLLKRMISFYKKQKILNES